MENKVSNDLLEKIYKLMVEIRKDKPRFCELAMRYLKGEKLSDAELETLRSLVEFFMDYGEELPQGVADALKQMDNFQIQPLDDTEELCYADLAEGLRQIMEEKGDWIEYDEDEPPHDIEEWLSFYGFDD